MSRHLRILLEAGVVGDERVADRCTCACVLAARRTRSSCCRRGSTRCRRTGTSSCNRSSVMWKGRDRHDRAARGHVHGRRQRRSRTAFTAFTDEMDNWWMRTRRSPSTTPRAWWRRRCEPGVGGRILEVYDDVTGDVLELGRITVWEPGARLQWLSSGRRRRSRSALRADRGRHATCRCTRACSPAETRTVTGSFSFVRSRRDWYRPLVRATRHRVARASRSNRGSASSLVLPRSPRPRPAGSSNAFGFEPRRPTFGEDTTVDRVPSRHRIDTGVSPRRRSDRPERQPARRT